MGSLKKLLVFAVYFPPACVVLLALRQQGCVVRLGRQKISSQILSSFLSEPTIQSRRYGKLVLRNGGLSAGLALWLRRCALRNSIVYNAEDARACRRKGVIRTRDFTRGAAVNLEPAASLGLHRDDISNNYKALRDISPKLADQYFNIVTLDTLIYNLDRHTHNFGVLRDATTGEILSLAPNYDNNLSLLYGIHGMQKRTAANDALFGEWKVFVQSNLITAPLPELTQAALHDILSGIDCGAAPEDIARAETFILAGYDMMQRALLLQPDPVEHEDVSTDKAYLETGLPPSIQKAIAEYVQGKKTTCATLTACGASCMEPSMPVNGTGQLQSNKRTICAENI